MDGVAGESRDERAALFQETAARMGLNPVIVEKDFWVCWSLRRLSQVQSLPRLLFKGGTSLSKAFDLIARFSEDVDLAFHRHDLGFEGDHDPALITSRGKRGRAVDGLKRACAAHIETELLPKLRVDFGDRIQNSDWGIEIDSADPQTVVFDYPSALSIEVYGGLQYIRPAVRLELGATSDHDPAERLPIRPYVAQEFPNEFTVPACHVVTLAPERTFWEKATHLHAVNHKPEKGRHRVSRHCYDIVMMSRRGVADSSLARLDILEAVVRHKVVCFDSAWADDPAALPGTFRLAPCPELEGILREDFEHIQPMFFRDAPSWEEIVAELTDIDRRINE